MSEIKSTRAKFRCHEVADHKNYNNEGYHKQVVKFSAVSDGEGENSLFHTSSPWGNIEIHIANKAVHDFFVSGKEYYLDFTPAIEQ